MRNPRIVKHQRTRVINTGKDCGEGSPYWDHVREHQPQDQDGSPAEPAQGNPDVLSEGQQPFAQESGITVGDITRQLTGQQRKVFELYVQGGKSESEIGIILGIGESTVRTYLQRIRERFRFYV